MIENYKQAVEEYKRADHLYHVSLKYTRTVDVIRSVMERYISTFENAIDAILKVMKEEKKLEDIPNNPVGKAGIALEKCGDDEMCKDIEIYLKLRRLMRCPYTKREEFRRHVTMVTDFDGEIIDVNIDLLGEYYDIVREFLTYTKERVAPYREE